MHFLQQNVDYIFSIKINLIYHNFQYLNIIQKYCVHYLQAEKLMYDRSSIKNCPENCGFINCYDTFKSTYFCNFASSTFFVLMV